MEEIKVRLTLTEIIMDALRQGFTIDDLKKILKTPDRR